jgi:O-antigen ligase
LAILPARFETYDTTPKLAVLCLGLALILWLPSRWWAGAAASWRTPVGRAFYSLLFLAVASLLLSTAFSNDVWLSLAGTVWRRLGALDQTVVFLIAAAVAACVYRNRAAARALMLAMEAAGAIASIYAILQYAGWDPLIPAHLYKLGSEPAAVRPPATLTQATYFATFLLPAVLIAAASRIRETSSRSKRLHEIVLVLSMAALVLSGTRSALLGLAAGAFALLYFERARLANRRTLAQAACGILAFAVLVGAFVLLPAGKGIRVRLAQWVTDRAGGPRLLVWRDSLSLVGQHPVLGAGPELFETEFRRAESVELARAYPDYYHESPHNFFLEAATGQGFVGLAVWVALLGLAGYSGVRCCRRGDSTGAALVASLLAMLVSLQFCPLTLTNELYLLVLGASLAALAAPQAAFESHPVVLTPVLSGCARALSVALVLMASAYVAQAALYTSTERRAYRGDLSGAGRRYETARKFPMPGPNLAVSREIASLAPRFSPPVRKEALAAAQLAAATAELGGAERFHALYQSAVLAIMSHDLPQAETKLRAAIDCAPTWYRPRMALACVLWWQGRNEEAQREAAVALDCAGRIAPNVKRTLDGARAQASFIAARSSP